MKKVVWFIKENGTMREIKVADLMPYTSQGKAMKITEYDIDHETHKVVEFKDIYINA
jgi:hypothetical protein